MVGRAKDLASRSQIGEQSQAKVSQNRMPLLVQHNIGGFDIAVDDPLAMRIVQSEADLSNDPADLSRFNEFLSVAGKHGTQISPFDELHRHIEQAVSLTIAIQADNVGML